MTFEDDGDVDINAFMLSDTEKQQFPTEQVVEHVALDTRIMDINAPPGGYQQQGTMGMPQQSPQPMQQQPGMTPQAPMPQQPPMQAHPSQFQQPPMQAPPQQVVVNVNVPQGGQGQIQQQPPQY